MQRRRMISFECYHDFRRNSSESLAISTKATKTTKNEPRTWQLHDKKTCCNHTISYYTIVHKYSVHVTSDISASFFPPSHLSIKNGPICDGKKAQPMKHPNPLPVPWRLHLVGQRDDSPNGDWMVIYPVRKTPLKLEDIQGYNMLLIIGLGFRQ